MIEWTDQAVQQLDKARDYIALSNCGEVADRVTGQIISCVEQLAVFPMSGRPGRVAGTREQVIADTPFVAAYAVDDANARVVILAIYHGAQRWPEVF